ncbi:hypothetical protein [Fimbriiglobus ruber]|uniref:Uncharacterized protein n=1 Tax=Fimbriiglobus ruber TaxID=1908690 RepID=A0A225DFR1_9BACT|nr:hypothetical protein [Fimbriiglobus ruber]OWK37348.1 hypothetical protein FRUB_06468 [Fimbriiglobus ruber]
MTIQHPLVRTETRLNGRHQHTYEAIFRHPTAQSLEWHDVVSLLDALADVVEGHDGSFHVTRDKHKLTLHHPKHKDIPAADVLAVRHFLEVSNEAEGPSPVAPGVRLLVVIDHREATIHLTESHGAVPQKILPYDPHGFGRHLRSRNEETDGKRQPERKSYYEAIAETLRGADQILIFGSGTGESSAVDQLLADLKANHPDVAEHVAGTVVTDGYHPTESQLLAKAREFFAPKSE